MRLAQRTGLNDGAAIQATIDAGYQGAAGHPVNPTPLVSPAVPAR
jgi:hypothetical protein